MEVVEEWELILLEILLSFARGVLLTPHIVTGQLARILCRLQTTPDTRRPFFIALQNKEIYFFIEKKNTQIQTIVISKHPLY